MATETRVITQDHILSGWKEIATHLGKSVRTAQRYQRHFALPVHRPAGKRKAAVLASQAEINRWVRSRDLSVEDRESQLDRLQDQFLQFKRTCRQTQELRKGLRESIAMLHKSITRVSLSRM